MSPAARTVWIWGLYAFLLAPVLLITPNFLLDLLGVPQTDEPWIRVLGVVVIGIGVYLISGAKSEADTFFRGTVLGRLIIGGGVIALAAVWGYWSVMLFGAVDVGGALWTWSALRKSKPASPIAAPTLG